MKVLFICTGNTCRSPIAEAMFNFISQKNNLNFFAFSAGTGVFFEENINSKAKLALEGKGILNFEHLSKQVTDDDVKSADIILTMTVSHKMMLKSKYQKYSHKIFTLCEKAYGTDKPISDPYGQSQEVYNLCLEEIKNAINVLIKLL